MEIKKATENVKSMENTRVCLQVLGDGFFEFFGVGAAEAVDLHSLLDEHEGGHRGDAVLHGDFLAFVNIDLKESEMLVKRLHWREVTLEEIARSLKSIHHRSS
jgi:hypothetical protein